MGFSELMHDAKVGPVSAQHKEFLGDILASARHLLQLINDVLDLAKVESGKMEFRPEPVDLPNLVGEVRDILRTLAAKKRIHIETEVSLTPTGVVVDPSKLKQVLYNYLSNALKFTPEEGRVTIRGRPEGEEAFCLEVEDTGIGIRQEDLGRLFVEFQQLDASAAKKYPGTGLGLALTKRIVEAQGGRVGVRSTPGQGSLFFVVLPRVATVRTEADASPEAAAPGTPRPGGPTILVIEDDGKDRRWLQEILGRAGYAVHTAVTGADALARCGEQTFDAITLDLLLPDMSGLDVLKAIRAAGPNRHVPIIVVTVVAERGAAAAFRIHDYLVKPLPAEELLASLARAGLAPDGTRKVLVVDDDPKALKLMETTLRQLGYHPICTPNGEDGLRAAEEEGPAAVVLDLLLPGIDGFEFLKRLRRTKNGRGVPVIVWTVKDLSEPERVRLKRSAQAVVLKSQGGTASLLEEVRAHLPVSREPTGAPAAGRAPSSPKEPVRGDQRTKARKETRNGRRTDPDR
jgi:DNA-binding response OmpR family regulator